MSISSVPTQQAVEYIASELCFQITLEDDRAAIHIASSSYITYFEDAVYKERSGVSRQIMDIETSMDSVRATLDMVLVSDEVQRARQEDLARRTLRYREQLAK